MTCSFLDQRSRISCPGRLGAQVSRSKVQLWLERCLHHWRHRKDLKRLVWLVNGSDSCSLKIRNISLPEMFLSKWPWCRKVQASLAVPKPSAVHVTAAHRKALWGFGTVWALIENKRCWMLRHVEYFGAVKAYQENGVVHIPGAFGLGPSDFQ